jgi:hypothetical protein
MRDPDSDAWWRATAEDGMVLVEIGEGEETTSTTEVDAWGEYSMPADIVLDELVLEQARAGFEFAPLEDVLAMVEAGHEVELTGRLRAFFETDEYRAHDGKYCERLGCTVDFTADSVLGNFYEEFYDTEAEVWRELIPISAKVVDDLEDEQAWIGVDPQLADGPVFELFTSNAFQEAYPNLDAFLADLS